MRKCRLRDLSKMDKSTVKLGGIRNFPNSPPQSPINLSNPQLPRGGIPVYTHQANPCQLWNILVPLNMS